MRSILIVSRNTPESIAIAHSLEQADYLVLTVDQVDDAIDCLSALVPGAILIDLPLSPARRLVRQLRARPGLRGIPRLLVVTNPLVSGLPPVAASFARPVDPGHLIRALPALLPRGITISAFLSPQPGQREERIDQALLHLQGPTDQLPAAIAVGAPAGARAAVPGGHARRRRRRALLPQPDVLVAP